MFDCNQLCRLVTIKTGIGKSYAIDIHYNYSLYDYNYIIVNNRTQLCLKIYKFIKHEVFSDTVQINKKFAVTVSTLILLLCHVISLAQVGS